MCDCGVMCSPEINAFVGLDMCISGTICLHNIDMCVGFICCFSEISTFMGLVMLLSRKICVYVQIFGSAL